MRQGIGGSVDRQIGEKKRKSMNAIQIDIINESSAPDAEILAAIPALQAQITEDFQPAWGIGADLHFVPKGGKPSPGHWWMGIFDTSDQPGALGYHDMTSEGLPFGKVFYATDKQYGEDWRVTTSHELLEILEDPYLSVVAFFQATNTTGTLVAYETADPTQGDTYEKLGVPVSNFVLPAYFEPGPHPKGTRFDRMGIMLGAFPDLRPGGYYSTFDIGKGGGWRQKSAELAPEHKRRAHKGSRRELRSIQQADRTWSTAHSARQQIGASADQ